MYIYTAEVEVYIYVLSCKHLPKLSMDVKNIGLYVYIYVNVIYIYTYYHVYLCIYTCTYIYIYILFQKVVTARSWFSLDECGLHNQDVQSYTEKSISSQTRTVGSDSRIQRSSFVTQH